MRDLVPVLALGVIAVSVISLFVAMPKPHDAVSKVREFSGIQSSVPQEESSDTSRTTETTPQPVAPVWGNLDFNIFGESASE